MAFFSASWMLHEWQSVLDRRIPCLQKGLAGGSSPYWLVGWWLLLLLTPWTFRILSWGGGDCFVSSGWTFAWWNPYSRQNLPINYSDIHPSYFSPDLLLEAVKRNAETDHAVYFDVIVRAVLQSLPQVPNTSFHSASHSVPLLGIGPSQVFHERFKPPSSSTWCVELFAPQQTQKQCRDFVAQPRCISTLVPPIMVDVALVEKEWSNTVNTIQHGDVLTWKRYRQIPLESKNVSSDKIIKHERGAMDPGVFLKEFWGAAVFQFL